MLESEETSKITIGCASFTEEDVGSMIYLYPRPWWLRIWHFIWFTVLRRKRKTYGAYVIVDIVDSITLEVK